MLKDRAYEDIRDNEDAVASEVASHLTGRENARRANTEFDRDNYFSIANAVAIKERVKNALQYLWDTVKSWFGSFTNNPIPYNRIAGMTLRELNKGTNVDAMVSGEASVELMMGDSLETFKARQKKAVDEKGVVTPGLNDVKVKIVGVPNHPYKGSWVDAKKAAIKDAVDKYTEIVKDENGKDVRVPKPQHYNNFGRTFTYGISKSSIEESVNKEQVDKSVKNEAPHGVHLAMLNHLDEIIGDSIEVEEHPDRNKIGGERDNNSINPDALMHRFYGVARVDGKNYSVMTLMRESLSPNRGNGLHAYEVTKIKVLDEKMPNTSNGVDTPNSELEGYPLAKVIEDVGKTMEPGKKLLVESEKTTNSDSPDFSIVQGNDQKNSVTRRREEEYAEAVRSDDR